MKNLQLRICFNELNLIKILFCNNKKIHHILIKFKNLDNFHEFSKKKHKTYFMTYSHTQKSLYLT